MFTIGYFRCSPENRFSRFLLWFYLRGCFQSCQSFCFQNRFSLIRYGISAPRCNNRRLLPMRQTEMGSVALTRQQNFLQKFYCFVRRCRDFGESRHCLECPENVRHADSVRINSDNKTIILTTRIGEKKKFSIAVKLYYVRRTNGGVCVFQFVFTVDNFINFYLILNQRHKR